MKKIQMVDLNGQYQKIKSEIDKSILNVIESTAFINGPEVKTFQADLEKYLDVNHVIPCANGTDALQIALMALDLNPGDEIITVNFTFAATVEVIELLQLKSVLVDVNQDDFTMNIEALKKAITSKTKAIIPVHLFGQCADMEIIMKIAKENNLFVIEDNAQAIGADYIFKDGTRKKAGTIGDIGTTSFFPSKNLGCYGDGGAIFSNNKDIAYKIKGIVNHGMYKRYYHDEVGVNSRLDSIQAAVLRIKLPHLDEYCAERLRVANFYNEAFKDLDWLITPKTAQHSTHVFHQYTLVTKGIDRDELREFLTKKEVPAMIYYPVPLHLQKAYADERYNEVDFPVTESLCETVISLPMQTELTQEQMDYIVKSVKEYK